LDRPPQPCDFKRVPRSRVHAACACVIGLAAVILWLVGFPCPSPASEVAAPATTNTFPAVSEVLHGRIFTNDIERDVFFLRAIHDHFAAHWPDLLEANISVGNYVLYPSRLLRFVDELGKAMRDQNDPAACTNLATITGDADFYANTNVSHPEIVRAAAGALIDIGPNGRKALASAFTESRYRNDPASLELLAQVIGEDRPADAELVGALAAAAFDFSTASGGTYSHCTTVAVTNLLCLSGGDSAVRTHLAIAKVFDNPGRFQAIIDGVAAAQAGELATNLAAVQSQVQTRLAGLTNSPGAYRDDLQELESRIERTLASFEKAKKDSH
jgi:hypothetical protein